MRRARPDASARPPSPSPLLRARAPPNRRPAHRRTTERRYALRVRVQGKTFRGEESQESALREVDLRVRDVNEPPWLVDARWKPEHALDRAIDENSAVGTPVGAPILSHDVDARDEHALVYALEGASAAGLGVSRDEWEAQLEVAGALNHEDPRLGHTRSLTLVATDTDFDGDRDGRGALSARAAITLVVGDVNDPPALRSAGVHATGLVIPRDAPQGAEIASLASFVHDEDRDALEYTMVDDDGGEIAAPLFDVNRESGRLTVGTPDM